MKKLWAVLGSIVFFVIAPGTVVGLIPWLMTGWRIRTPLPGYAPVRNRRHCTAYRRVGSPGQILRSRASGSWNARADRATREAGRGRLLPPGAQSRVCWRGSPRSSDRRCCSRTRERCGWPRSSGSRSTSSSSLMRSRRFAACSKTTTIAFVPTSRALAPVARIVRFTTEAIRGLPFSMERGCIIERGGLEFREYFLTEWYAFGLDKR